MRLIVFFDLPMVSPEDRKQYSRFHKYLINQGFIRMQESVYSKIALNSSIAKTIKDDLERHKPDAGNVQILSVSERQYQDIMIIVGESQKEIVDTLDRFVII